MPDFSIDHDNLLRALMWAGHGLPVGVAHTPVLKMIKVDARPGTVSFSAYDYETAATATVSAEVTSPGVAFLPGRLAADVAARLPNAPVKLSSTGRFTDIKCGPAHFTLAGLDEQAALGYPALPEVPAVSGVVPASQFAAAVSQVGVAAAADDTLPVLTAICLELADDALRLVATDRFRLAVRTVDWKAEGHAGARTALVPARLLQAAAKALPADLVTIAVDEDANLARFSSGGWTLTTRLIAGEWPRWQKLVPSTDDFTGTAIVDTAEFTKAVQRVALVAPPSTPVTLTFTTGQVLLEASGQSGSATDTLGATHRGDDIALHFTPAYLLDAVKSTDAPRALLRFTGPRRPVVVSPAPAQDDDRTGGEPEFVHVISALSAVDG